MCVCGAGEGCDGVVWDSVVWHGMVLVCGVWLSSCVRGVQEGCDGIVVGDGRVLPSGIVQGFQIGIDYHTHKCQLAKQNKISAKKNPLIVEEYLFKKREAGRW